MKLWDISSERKRIDTQTYMLIKRDLFTIVSTIMHEYIYTYIHTYIHTYMHTYIHTFVRTYNMFSILYLCRMSDTF